MNMQVTGISGGAVQPPQQRHPFQLLRWHLVLSAAFLAWPASADFVLWPERDSQAPAVKAPPVQSPTPVPAIVVAPAPVAAQAPAPAPPTPAAPVGPPARRVLATSASASLSLRELFESALSAHPSLMAARLQARASAQEVTAVQRQRWPVLSVVAETDTGTRASTATRSLRVEQTLWDAGLHSARVTESEARTRVAQAQVYLQQQDLFIQIINAWQSLIGANERQRVAQETLERLRTYQEQMQRRVEAQASPPIDLELADARVLQTEVELTSASSSLQVALTRLEQLSNLTGLAQRVNALPPVPSVQATEDFMQQLQATDWTLIASQHASVTRARHERHLAVNQLGTKRAEQWPQLYLRWDKPLSSTETNSVTKPSLFAGLRYSPGAGFSGLAEAMALSTRIDSQDQLVEAALREIQQTLQSDREEFANARSRLVALERSVEGSTLVLESYVRQFQAGRKSWQDLLNAARDLAQNQYNLADARASLVGALHRLQLRMDQSPEFP